MPLNGLVVKERKVEKVQRLRANPLLGKSEVGIEEWNKKVKDRGIQFD